MKIGVLGCFYECAGLLPQVLEPWEKLKNEGYSLVVGAINVQFKEYAELGYPNNDTKTREILREHKDLFDILHIHNEPLTEKEARTLILKDVLAKEVDVVWMLDGDEVYTAEQIKNIIAYVEKTPRFDYYHLYLDNYVFDGKKWGEDFFPPRIIRTDRSGGIKEFTWDNEIVFNDGSVLYDRVPGIVPKKLAHIAHYTWRRENAEKKLAYHHRHFGYSAVKIGAGGNLEFDPEYFLLHKLPLPAHSPEDSKAWEKTILNFSYSIEAIGADFMNLLEALLVIVRTNNYIISLTVVPTRIHNELAAGIAELQQLCPFDLFIAAQKPEGAIEISGDKSSLELNSLVQYLLNFKQKDAVGGTIEKSMDDIRLNLGCGFKKYDGYINVDSAPQCKPDMVVNLEQFPWPWKDNSVSEIKLEHVLEHLGATSDIYINIWKEMWRVCKNGALIDITVPHWNHENFHHDPTHVRPITPIGIAMFDQARNIKDAEAGGRETKLGLFTGVDIRVEDRDISYSYTGKMTGAIGRGELVLENLEHLREHQNNIADQISIKAHVVKPARGEAWLAAQSAAGKNI